MTKSIKLALFCCFVLIISGCSATIAEHSDAVKPITDASKKLESREFKAAVDSGEMVDDGWLKSFNDPMLDKLVEEALEKNPGIKIAQARVEQANALTRVAQSAQKPTVALAGSYSSGDIISNGSVTAGTSAGGALFSWEPDVWGKIANSVAGAKEGEKATAADYEFARQSLVASVAKAWFTATTSKLFYNFAKQIVDINEEALRIAQVKKDVGQGNTRDVHKATAQLSLAKEAASKAQLSYEKALRSLEVILGRYPSADLKTQDTLVAVPPPFPVGIPSNILERRPDLIAAESRVAQAFYSKQEADLLHLPTFSLSLGAGLTSLENVISSLTAGIYAPLYTGGRIEAEVDQATAKQKESIAAYAQVALKAFQEVENALSTEKTLLERQQYISSAVAENKASYDLTKKQYEIGQGSMLDVISEQNSWISSQIAKLNIDNQLLINRVNTHLALGGSFEEKK